LIGAARTVALQDRTGECGILRSFAAGVLAVFKEAATMKYR
jgi:hypothetical protein